MPLKQEILHHLQHVKIVNCRNKLDNQHVCYEMEGGLRIGGSCSLKAMRSLEVPK